MFKRIGIVICVILLIFLCGCTQETKETTKDKVQNEHPIIGKWYNPLANNVYMTFEEDGNGEAYGDGITLQFKWELLENDQLVFHDFVDISENQVFNIDIVSAPEEMSEYNDMMLLYLNSTDNNSGGILLTSIDLRAPSPMAGLPWMSSSDEIFMFGYPLTQGETQLYIRKIVDMRYTDTPYMYEYHNGFLTLTSDPYYTNGEQYSTNISVEFENDNKMMFTWINSSDDVVRWDGLTLTKIKENQELSEQFSTLIRYVLGTDGLKELASFENYQVKIFNYTGTANYWYNSGNGEWTEIYVEKFDPVDEHGVIIENDIFDNQYSRTNKSFSQNGTDMIISYLTEVTGSEWPEGSEIYVYTNKLGDQLIYYKENETQIYPYLIGWTNKYDIDSICWIPEYNYSWMWDTDCMFIEEPSPGIYIDISEFPTNITANEPFDIQLHFYNYENGDLVDPSDFFVRIAGAPCRSSDFIREATGIYYLYEYVIDEKGEHDVEISAFRGNMTDMVMDEKDFKIYTT